MDTLPDNCTWRCLPFEKPPVRSLINEDLAAPKSADVESGAAAVAQIEGTIESAADLLLRRDTPLHHHLLCCLLGQSTQNARYVRTSHRCDRLAAARRGLHSDSRH